MEVNMSELKSPEDLKKYPPDTIFIMDKNEREIKIPDGLKKQKSSTADQ